MAKKEIYKTDCYNCHWTGYNSEMVSVHYDPPIYKGSGMTDECLLCPVCGTEIIITHDVLPKFPIYM
jgi:hypothetical protein